jgi:hypothetical protein
MPLLMSRIITRRDRHLVMKMLWFAMMGDA